MKGRSIKNFLVGLSAYLLALFGILLVVPNYFQYVWKTVKDYTWRTIKWLLRKLTHLCELQRIIYGELPGAKRFLLVEKSLERSRSPTVRLVLKNLERKVKIGHFNTRHLRKMEVDNAAHAISHDKSVNIRCHTGFVPKLAQSLEMIYSYKDLCSMLETMKAIPYDSGNQQHENKLMEIWNNFRAPEILTARKSLQWQFIGFQGNDPATDFRGSGELGLNFMLWFSRTHTERARQVMSTSNHPKYECPLAVLMINIVSDSYHMFARGEAKTHFFNKYATVLALDEAADAVDFVTRSQGLMGVFYDFCSVLLIEFSNFYVSKRPPNLLSFPPIYADFKNIIKERLQDLECQFQMDIRTI